MEAREDLQRSSKSTEIRSVILPRVSVDSSVVEGFRHLLGVYSVSCVVADAQCREGVMSSAIKLLDHKGKFAGPALTVKLYPGDLVDCLHALKTASPGDVIVVDAGAETETSVWGGLMAGLCKLKGIMGAVVDGSIRDTDEIRDQGFPIASRGIVPRSTHSPYSGRLDTLQINVPVSCGDVIVRPGDIVVADEIGVVVVAREEAGQVLERAQQQAEQEEKTRARIREGKTVDELLAEFGRL